MAYKEGFFFCALPEKQPKTNQDKQKTGKKKELVILLLISGLIQNYACFFVQKGVLLTGRTLFFNRSASTSFPIQHMFKSKTDFNAFDKHNEKVANVEPKKMKGLSKNAVKKLLGAPTERTSFFLILNYFQDPAGKPAGHFLDFGTNKKLAKHFEQVEMKSGKLDKSMSASQKEASMGEVYAKEENGKKLLYFEPDAASKIPSGKWPKILKELKPLINSMKAVVVLEGQIIGEGEEETPTNTEDTATSTLEEGIGLEELKGLFRPISKMLKETLPKEIVPRVKAKTVTAQDDQAVDELQAQVQAFLEAYEQGQEDAKTALAKVKATLEGQLPKIEQIAAAIKANTPSGTPTDTVEEELPPTEQDQQLLKNLEELLQKAETGLSDFDKKHQQLQPELDTPNQPLPEGSSFLAGINV